MATTVPNTFANDTTADAVQVNANFTAHNTAIDGVATAAGVPTPAAKQRGGVVVGTSETRNNAVFGLLPTPDQVTGVVVPTLAVMRVYFQATVNTAAADAEAAIFIGANQLRIGGSISNGAGPLTQSAPIGSTGGADRLLVSSSVGLTTISGSHVDVTTGQIFGAVTSGNPVAQQFGAGGTTITISNTLGALGGPVALWVAAGTYTVSAQFRATGGVTVKNRRLYVEVVGF